MTKPILICDIRMHFVSFSTLPSSCNDTALFTFTQISYQFLIFFILKDTNVINKGPCRYSQQSLPSIFAHSTVAAALLPIDSCNSFQSQMRQIMHSRVSFNYYVTSVTSVTSIRCSSSDSLVCEKGNLTITSIAT